MFLFWWYGFGGLKGDYAHIINLDLLSVFDISQCSVSIPHLIFEKIPFKHLISPSDVT